MGLGSNHMLTSFEQFSDETMVKELVEKPDASISPLTTSPSRKPKSPVLKLRRRTLSKMERDGKSKSTAEEAVLGRSVRKTLSDTSGGKKRPSSQFYVSGDDLFGPEDPRNLRRLTSVTSGSQPVLSAIDQLSVTPDNSPGLLSRYAALRTSTPHLSPVDSLLQRVRKSFAFRFQKKKADLSSSRCNLDMDNSMTKSVPGGLDHGMNGSSNILEEADNEESAAKTPAEDAKTEAPKNFHNIVLRTMKEKRSTRKRMDYRMSLICDNLINVPNDKFLAPPLARSSVMNCPTGSEANLLRKRAASTSDYSPKSKSIQRPLSITDNLPVENSATDDKQPMLIGVSDADTNDDSKSFMTLDQIWRNNPVRLCKVQSRLLMCRHKGRYRLRRSISHPVELESLGSSHNLHETTQGLTEADNFPKGSSSDDDAASSDSDIYHSFCCSPTRRSNTCWELSSEGGVFVEALWDHETSDSEELPFQVGDLIEVTDSSDREWWWGTRGGRGGWFPASFVRYINHSGPSNEFNLEPSDSVPNECSPCKTSIHNLSCEQVRANIVQEIVATERDYVKHLKDVVEGYLKQVHRRPDMFSKERIDTVFGNIKDIYVFQSQFLKQLEECLDEELPHLSQIGNAFLVNKEKFKMYSEYCNNHPLAVSELQELYCDSQYTHFFEACRLLQEMIDISLDGFLLTPIQRICKYPLQLAELLKFTDLNHPDHIPVSKALAAMKEVAELVNERKRRMECLERLAEWQTTIEGWEGPDVLDTSSILIHCGEVTRVTSSWSRDVYIFIFDHLLVYCKKDLLKRHTYAYKGRLNLDSCDIVDVEDGKDAQFALSVKNAWKIHCKEKEKEKWYLFYAKTAPEKDQWLNAFKTERKRVSDDKEQGFVVTDDAKKAARLAVQNKQKPKRPRAKFSKGRRCHPDVAVTELLLDPPSAKARTGSLPSNIHPELAIMAGAKLGPPRKKGSGWFHFGSGKKPKS